MAERVRPVEPTDGAALAALFDACACPCACRYLHFAGDKNEWLMRCASPERENFTELAAALDARGDEALGVVAEDAGRAGDLVAWLKVVPAASAAKAFEQRTYRGLPCLAARDGLFLLGCVLVRPDRRRAGLVSALVAGALALARARGARAVVALPRVPREPVSDAELWTLPHSVLDRAGFRQVGGELPYPVLRLAFAGCPDGSEAEAAGASELG